VELVAWPERSGLRRALAHAGVPRVLLVDNGTLPPPSLGVDEEWVWSDAPDHEVDERARSVLARLQSTGEIEDRGDDTFCHAGRPFRLPRLQARLFAELAAHRGTPVARERLIEVGWPERNVSHALEVEIGRLRDRLVGTGLFIRSLRHGGYELA
jgi:DNA-binding response OmpR family regulator